MRACLLKDDFILWSLQLAYFKFLQVGVLKCNEEKKLNLDTLNQQCPWYTANNVNLKLSMSGLWNSGQELVGRSLTSEFQYQVHRKRRFTSKVPTTLTNPVFPWDHMSIGHWLILRRPI